MVHFDSLTALGDDRFPLFPGKDEVDQIKKIHKIMGTPSRELLMKFKKCGRVLAKFVRAVYGCGCAAGIPRVTWILSFPKRRALA